jgi:hypothetical protein
VMSSKRFRPKHEHEDCKSCVFLGQYTYSASFTTGWRKTVVDLHCCTNPREPSVIARFGAGGKYSSMPLDVWTTKEKTLGTFGPALDEAVKRAVALDLIKLPKGRRPEWLDGMIVETTIRLRASDVVDGVQLLENAAKEAKSILAFQRSGSWARQGNGVESSVLVEFAPFVEPTKLPLAFDTSATATPPLDPLTFLDHLAADAQGRADRLEKYAAGVERELGGVIPASREARETAARYRLRAETYATAKVEMKRAIEGDGGRS